MKTINQLLCMGAIGLMIFGAFVGLASIAGASEDRGEKINANMYIIQTNDYGGEGLQYMDTDHIFPSSTTTIDLKYAFYSSSLGLNYAQMITPFNNMAVVLKVNNGSNQQIGASFVEVLHTNYYTYTKTLSVNAGDYLNIEISYYAKISDLNYTGDCARKTLNFKVGDAAYIPPTINITSPILNEEITANSVYRVFYNITDGTAPYTVYLNYTYDDGVTYYPVTNYTTETSGDDCYYDWTVADYPSELCDINATVIDTDMGKDSNWTDTFTILTDYVSPTIILDHPTEGDNSWVTGTQHYIVWNISDGTPNYNLWINFTSDNEVTWHSIVSVLGTSETSGYYLWTVPYDNVSDDCLMSARVFDSEMGGQYIDGGFEILAAPVSVELLTPETYDIYHVGDIMNITWEATGGTGDLNISLYFYNTGPLAYSPVKNNPSTGPFVWWYCLAGDVSNTGYYNWEIVNYPVEYGEIGVMANDTLGVSDNDYCSSITILSPAIAVNITSPIEGDNLTIGEDISIAWDIIGGIGDFNISLYYTLDDENYTQLLDNVSSEADDTYTWDASGIFTEDTTNVSLFAVVLDQPIADIGFPIGEGGYELLEGPEGPDRNETRNGSGKFNLVPAPIIPPIIPPSGQHDITIINIDPVETAYIGDDITVNAMVSCQDGITSVYIVFWYDDGDNASLEMDLSAGDFYDGNYTLAIPGMDTVGTLHYYIVAVSDHNLIEMDDEYTVDITAKPILSGLPAYWYIYAIAAIITMIGGGMLYTGSAGRKLFCVASVLIGIGILVWLAYPVLLSQGWIPRIV